jgi:glycosyltransferase involved in cell wall biosynthesis
MAKNKKTKKKKNNAFPFVSICTPTFNRRPFIPALINCVKNQKYPLNRIEWIIIDDGTDPIEDLVIDIKEVKYFKYDTKLTLGNKRNLCNKKAQGEIIIYMDDDDYYPTTRVSHAVQKLLENPDKLCAGSSEIHIWFSKLNKLIQFGPYSENHATAGTFAFKKKLLETCSFNENASLAEEKHFLSNYTIPLIQLDPIHVIISFSHDHNTFNKEKLLYKESEYIKDSNLSLSHFIKDDNLINFYTKTIHECLSKYDIGAPKYKPDVIMQMLQMEEARRIELEHKLAQTSTSIVIMQGNNKNIKLNSDEVVDLLQSQQSKIVSQNKQIDELAQRNLIFEENILKQSVIISKLQTENSILIEQTQSNATDSILGGILGLNNSRFENLNMHLEK